MKRLSVYKFLNKILAVPLIFALAVSFSPVIHKAFATNDFTVSNLTFNPATGFYSFDYTGIDLQSGSDSLLSIYDTTGTTSYWKNTAGHCTSSHCSGSVASTANSDSGVTQVILRTESGSHYVSQTLSYPLSLPTSNTSQTVRYDTQLYALSLSSDTTTTTNATASFGSVTLPVKSNVCVLGSLGLQNNTSALGLQAQFVVDGTSYALVGDTVALSSLGITYTVARNLCIPNMTSGSHSFSVKIDQFPFRSGDQIVIKSGSTLSISAYPTQ